MPNMLTKNGSATDTYIYFLEGDGSNSTPFSNAPSLRSVQTTFTRPADTNAYAANDAVSNSTSAPSVLTFVNAARINGGGGYITTAFCYTSQTAMTGQLRLHLFQTSPTALNDNAAYTLLNANNTVRIGWIDFTTFNTGGSGSDTAMSFGAFPGGASLPYVCDSGATSIFGMVETRNAFTPANAQTFRFHLLFDRY